MTILRMDNVGVVGDDLEAAPAFFGELGLELAQYEDTYRLCYLRSPEGIIVGLAEELPAAGAR